MPDARGAHAALFSTSLQRATRGQQVPASQLGMVGTGYRVPSIDTPGYRISVLDT